MALNNLGRSLSCSSDPVFIEKNAELEISEMRNILSSGSSEDIKNFLFSSINANDLNIGKITERQIKKHSEVLSHQNKSYLKNLLKHQKEKKEDKSELKGFNEQKTHSGLE